MGEKRRVFTREFKIEAVRLVQHHSGTPVVIHRDSQANLIAVSEGVRDVSHW